MKTIEQEFKQFAKRGTVTSIKDLTVQEQENHLGLMNAHADNLSIYLNRNTSKITQKQRTHLFAMIKESQGLIKALTKQINNHAYTVGGRSIVEHNFIQ